eukprot:CAMPEP_0172386112 /NCGR_PEP_ID=MMETSP1061-20121228/3712_1 /TAXON_ID=37318 /ORGANISM="Pseudo-nitzschia pungens, Strain cf. pungens" /LENGTH=220 /DNA_ID=CAMNT_0013115381 /DNA_START=175 /DNA_END=837 /DNA_ORIENTATION=+
MTLSSRFLARTLPLVARSGSALSGSTNKAAAATSASSVVRHYRGDTGEAVHQLTPKEQELLARAVPRAKAIRADHVKATPDDDTRRKRLVYRAKQRGWLEVDLLLGTWASENVPHLSEDELDQFEDFVNLETIDIYNVITLRLGVPEELKRPGGTGVVERIQEWARSHPLGKGDPDAYEAAKKEHKLYTSSSNRVSNVESNIEKRISNQWIGTKENERTE